MLRKKLGHIQNAVTTEVTQVTSEEDLLKSVVKLSMVPDSRDGQSRRTSKVQNGFLWDQLQKAFSHANT